ncbi:MAG: hypothetical protein HY040_23950 [Planctomycetes bacterium]|nr:hypothetical protein [Planctomycetota bacterium]
MPTESTTKSTKTKPVHEVRFGRVKAVIWANKNGDGKVRHNVQVRRIYKEDGSSDWKSSDSLGRDDLLTAAKVLNTAHSWIHEHEQEHEET